MPNKEDLARALTEARSNLEEQIRTAIREHRRSKSGSFTLEMDEAHLAGNRRFDEPAKQELGDRIRMLVDAFRQQPAVIESGMFVYKLTAIDSDGDGEAAVDVKYEYRSDTGMK